MSRQFSIPTVLRSVPNSMLREFLVRCGHVDPELTWEKLSENDVDPIRTSIENLPPARLDDVESTLHMIFELGCEGGTRAILEAGARCGKPNLGEDLPQDVSFYGKAMWAWLHHNDAFQKAQIIFQLDNLSWWRKRNDIPSIQPDLRRESVDALEGAVCKILSEEGRGKECTVEYYKRGDVHYFFAHPDDYAHQVFTHNEHGKLSSVTFRHTLSVVFAYDQRAGSLELNAKLSKKSKEALEKAFALTILHWSLGPHHPGAAYELNQLNEAAFVLETDPQDRLSVHVRKMRLTVPHAGRRILIEVDDDAPGGIHRAIRESINLQNTPLSSVNVTLVNFGFEFLELEGRKSGRQSFDVSFPNSCSLRNARPERVQTIQKYLRRWGIDGASLPELVSSEAGD